MNVLYVVLFVICVSAALLAVMYAIGSFISKSERDANNVQAAESYRVVCSVKDCPYSVDGVCRLACRRNYLL